MTGARRTARLFVALASLAVPGHAAPPCAENLRELRALVGDPSFPLSWRETSMDDGKPLVLSILERDGALFLHFHKTDEGLWAEGACSICSRGSGLTARIGFEQVRLGPAAHWTARLAFAGGAEFNFTRLGPARMRIDAGGWSGTFAAP